MARPRLDESKKKQSKTVTLSNKDIELFDRLGKGNLSAGIEAAAAIVREVAVARGVQLPPSQTEDDIFS